MLNQNWKREICTIPNLLSLFRLLLLPVYTRIYLNAREPREFLLAGALMGLSCLTDLADGWVARRFDQTSNFGKVLDPLADKLTQVAVTICLSIRYPILKSLLILLLLKELFQVTAGIGFLMKGQILPGALMAGKVSTAVLFVSLILLVIFPDASSKVTAALAALNMGFLSLSFGCYLLAYFGDAPRLRNLEQKKDGGP